MYETSSVDGSTSTNFDTEHFGRGQKQNFNQKGTKINEGNPEDPSHLSLFGPQWHYYGKSDC